jgi:hypothetical protein
MPAEIPEPTGPPPTEELLLPPGPEFATARRAPLYPRTASFAYPLDIEEEFLGRQHRPSLGWVQPQTGPRGVEFSITAGQDRHPAIIEVPAYTYQPVQSENLLPRDWLAEPPVSQYAAIIPHDALSEIEAARLQAIRDDLAQIITDVDQLDRAVTARWEADERELNKYKFPYGDLEQWYAPIDADAPGAEPEIIVPGPPPKIGPIPKAVRGEDEPRVHISTQIFTPSLMRRLYRDEAGAVRIPDAWRQRRRDWLPEGVDFRHPNPEVERRISASEDDLAEASWVKAMSAARTAWHKLTRTYEHIPHGDPFSPYIEFLRLSHAAVPATYDDAFRNMFDIVEPLGGRKQMKVFQRILNLRNRRWAVNHNQGHRYGMTSLAEDIEKPLANLENIAQQVPEISRALRRRDEYYRPIRDKLVEIGAIGPEALENDDYFHQEILNRIGVENWISRLTGRLRPKIRKRGFQKHRVTGDVLRDERYDPSGNYLVAEMGWLHDALLIIRQHELHQILANEDARFRARIRADAARQGIDYEMALKDRIYNTRDLDLWSPKVGHPLFKAFTIPDKIGEALMQGVIDEAKIIPKNVHTVMAIAGKHRAYLMPVEVALELNKQEKPHIIGPIRKLFRYPFNAMRGWFLLGPPNIGAYNLRNLSDLEPLFTVFGTKAFRGLNQIKGELFNYHYGQSAVLKRAAKEVKKRWPELELKTFGKPISARIKLARDMGVIGSGQVAAELTDVPNMSEFRQFTGRPIWALPGVPMKKYFQYAARATQFRENTGRLAAFVLYRDMLKKHRETGAPVHYGASKPAMIEQLREHFNDDIAAAKLARDLMLDYNDISVTGQAIRRDLAMFWAWTEGTVTRWPRIVANNFQYAKAQGTSGAAAVALPAATAAAKTAVFAGAVYLRMAALYGALWAWNNLIMNEVEDKLSDDEKSTPHINLGFNADGTARVFRNFGALGDLLNFFGIHDLWQLIPEWRAGQITPQEVAKELVRGGVQRFVDLIRPDYKAVPELLTGQSYWPDIFNPRQIARDEHAANIVGLADEYRMLRGALGSGHLARPHYAQRYFTGISDPRWNALSLIHARRSRFLKQKGRDVPNFGASPIRIMRDAAASNNYYAFRDAKNRYIEAGHNYQTFLQSLANIDPIGNRLNEALEYEFTYKFLTNRDRNQLRLARDFAHQLQQRMVWWWALANFEQELGLGVDKE